MKYALYSYNTTTGKHTLLCESKNRKAVQNEARFLQSFEKSVEKIWKIITAKADQVFPKVI